MVQSRPQSGRCSRPCDGQSGPAERRSRRGRPGRWPPCCVGLPADPGLLHLAGLVRMHQQRLEEAAELFARPGPPTRAKPLWPSAMARPALAGAQLSEAANGLRAPPGTQARLMPKPISKLGALLHRSWASWRKPRSTVRQWLRAMPDNVHAKLALGAMLLDARRPAEAETPAAPGAGRGRGSAPEGAAVSASWPMALRRQRKDEEALAAL